MSNWFSRRVSTGLTQHLHLDKCTIDLSGGPVRCGYDAHDRDDQSPWLLWRGRVSRDPFFCFFYWQFPRGLKAFGPCGPAFLLAVREVPDTGCAYSKTGDEVRFDPQGSTRVYDRTMLDN